MMTVEKKKILFLTVNMFTTIRDGLPIYYENLYNFLTSNSELVEQSRIDFHFLNVVLTEDCVYDTKENLTNFYIPNFYSDFPDAIITNTKFTGHLSQHSLNSDVIITPDSMFWPALTFLKENQGIKKLVSFIHLYQKGLWLALSNDVNNIKEKYTNEMENIVYFTLLEAEQMYNSNYIIANSDSTKNNIELLSNNTINHIVSIPLGIDKDYWSFKYKNISKKIKNNEPLRFLYVGRFCNQKGIKNLMNDFVLNSELYRENTNLFEVHLYGDYTTFSNSEEICKPLNNVFLHGSLSQDELKEEMKKGDFIITLNNYEPFGLFLNEALSVGLIPVIRGEKLKSNLKDGIYDQIKRVYKNKGICVTIEDNNVPLIQGFLELIEYIKNIKNLSELDSMCKQNRVSAYDIKDHHNKLIDFLKQISD